MAALAAFPDVKSIVTTLAASELPQPPGSHARRKEALQRLVELLKENTDGSIEKDLAQCMGNLLVGCRREVYAADAELASLAIKALGYMLCAEPLVELVTEDEAGATLDALVDAIERTKHKTTCTFALWCLSQQNFAKKVLTNHMPKLVPAVVHGLSNPWASSAVAFEACAALEKLGLIAGHSLRVDAATWVPSLCRWLVGDVKKVAAEAERVVESLRSHLLPPTKDLSQAMAVELRGTLLKSLSALAEKRGSELAALRAWGWFAELAGDAALVNKSMLINDLLHVVETTFVSPNSDVRIASFCAWEALITTLTATCYPRKGTPGPPPLPSTRRLKLLMTPIHTTLKTANAPPQVKLACIKAWKHLLSRVKPWLASPAVFNLVGELLFKEALIAPPEQKHQQVIRGEFIAWARGCCEEGRGGDLIEQVFSRAYREEPHAVDSILECWSQLVKVDKGEGGVSFTFVKGVVDILEVALAESTLDLDLMGQLVESLLKEWKGLVLTSAAYTFSLNEKTEAPPKGVPSPKTPLGVNNLAQITPDSQPSQVSPPFYVLWLWLKALTRVKSDFSKELISQVESMIGYIISSENACQDSASLVKVLSQHVPLGLVLVIWKILATKLQALLQNDSQVFPEAASSASNDPYEQMVAVLALPVEQLIDVTATGMPNVGATWGSLWSRAYHVFQAHEGVARPNRLLAALCCHVASCIQGKELKEEGRRCLAEVVTHLSSTLEVPLHPPGSKKHKAACSVTFLGKPLEDSANLAPFFSLLAHLVVVEYQNVQRTVDTDSGTAAVVIGAARETVKKLAIQRDVLIFIQALLAPLSSWLHHTAASTTDSQSQPAEESTEATEKLHSTALSSLQHCRPPLTFDTPLLAALTPLLVPSLSHSTKAIANTTINFWQATFATAKDLEYPPQIRPVLEELRSQVDIILPCWGEEKTPPQESTLPSSGPEKGTTSRWGNLFAHLAKSPEKKAPPKGVPLRSPVKDTPPARDVVLGTASPATHPSPLKGFLKRHLAPPAELAAEAPLLVVAPLRLGTPAVGEQDPPGTGKQSTGKGTPGGKLKPTQTSPAGRRRKLSFLEDTQEGEFVAITATQQKKKGPLTDHQREARAAQNRGLLCTYSKLEASQPPWGGESQDVEDDGVLGVRAEGAPKPERWHGGKRVSAVGSAEELSQESPPRKKAKLAKADSETSLRAQGKGLSQELSQQGRPLMCESLGGCRTKVSEVLGGLPRASKQVLGACLNVRTVGDLAVCEEEAVRQALPMKGALATMKANLQGHAEIVASRGPPRTPAASASHEEPGSSFAVPDSLVEDQQANEAHKDTASSPQKEHNDQDELKERLIAEAVGSLPARKQLEQQAAGLLQASQESAHICKAPEGQAKAVERGEGLATTGPQIETELLSERQTGTPMKAGSQVPTQILPAAELVSAALERRADVACPTPEEGPKATVASSLQEILDESQWGQMSEAELTEIHWGLADLTVKVAEHLRACRNKKPM